MYFKRLPTLLAIISTLIITGCGDRIPKEINDLPIANAGIDQTVTLNQSLILRGTGRDDDGDIESYQWREGTRILSSLSIFSYPTDITGAHTLTLIVTDDKGATATDTIIVNVVSSNYKLETTTTIPTTTATTTTTYSTPISTATATDTTTTNTSTASEPVVIPFVEPVSTTSTTTITDTTVESDYQLKVLGSDTSINSSISLGNTPKSLYLILSNSANSSTTPIVTTDIIASKSLKVVGTIPIIEESKIIDTPDYVEDFKLQSSALVAEAKEMPISDISPRREDIVGNSKTFYLNQYGTSTTTASAKKIISTIATNMGTKTLNVWVSDDSFDSGDGCSKANCVTQDMVDVLADSFLKSGLDNDIYDWVTNIYGEEWGTNRGMIPIDDEITILLTDIDKDNNPNGGVIGFYWSKDNHERSLFTASNERLMFYVDSVMFANTVAGVWNIDTFWAKEVISTLAHELQHMISFYQKEVSLGTPSDTWLDEMLSDCTEDLVATKISSLGTRGVSHTDGSAGTAYNSKGRFPLYNANNGLSLTGWSKQLADYSKVSAFGAYLTRNYGGAKLLHDIMHSSFGDERAVVEAVNKSPNGIGKTFANLLNEWGIAVMLSEFDNITDIPTYNSGDFLNTYYGGTLYDMGSINFFNYIPAPMIHTTVGTINADSNYFYKIGDNLTGDVNIQLLLNGYTEATLIAK